MSLSTESFSGLRKTHWFVTTNTFFPQSSTFYVCLHVMLTLMYSCEDNNFNTCGESPAPVPHTNQISYLVIFVNSGFLTRVFFLIVVGKGIMHRHQIIGPVFDGHFSFSLLSAFLPNHDKFIFLHWTHCGVKMRQKTCVEMRPNPSQLGAVIPQSWCHYWETKPYIHPHF